MPQPVTPASDRGTNPRRAETALKTWAEERAIVLVAIGLLLCLLAIVIIIGLLHPR